MQISQKALKEAYAELEELRQQRREAAGWPDELYNFVVAATSNGSSRAEDHVSYDDVAAIVRGRGWYSAPTGNALSQAFRRERRRREELSEGEA